MKRVFAFAIFAVAIAPCHSRDADEGGYPPLTQPCDMAVKYVPEIVRVEPVPAPPTFTVDPARCETDGGAPARSRLFQRIDYIARDAMKQGHFGDAYQELAHSTKTWCSADEIAAAQEDLKMAASHSGQIGFSDDSATLNAAELSPAVDVMINSRALFGPTLFLTVGHYEFSMGTAGDRIPVDVRAGQRIVIKVHIESYGCGR